MIKLVEISKIYRTSEIETMALDNINLEVRDGEFVSIMGPSGCGKSTLLNIAGLLDEPSSGTVELHGKAVSGLNAREAARFRNTELGFVFQSFHLIPSLNVLDNVQMPLLYRKMGATERKERAMRMIEAVGLSHRVKHFPSQLSGGQCQRVAIARALVGDPSIILADEPTGNLDSKMGAEVMELLHEVNKQRGKTILMVTHNESQAKQTDRIVRIKKKTHETSRILAPELADNAQGPAVQPYIHHRRGPVDDACLDCPDIFCDAAGQCVP